jgi:hypothetical protein
VRGWPAASEWSGLLLGDFSHPALFIGVYTLAAALGKKRM